jgi:peptidoglycan/LPS O-acetylase OafA/YrhL
MNRKTCASFALALGSFVLLLFIFQRILPGAEYIEVTASIDHANDRMQVFYASRGSFTEQRSVFSRVLQENTKERLGFTLGHAPVHHFRLDLGYLPGSLRLYQIRAGGYFARDITLGPAEIFAGFIPDSPATLMHLREDFLEIQTHNDSYLVAQAPLLRSERTLLYGLPLLFALLLFALCQQTEFHSLAPLRDIQRKQPSVGENIQVLDGLRGFALLLVVADHTWGHFTGHGATGVWIFMTLSGFLIAKPFIQQGERAVSLDFLQHFFIRRLRRILPVYYTYITVVYVLSRRFDEALLHFFFLKGSGHLWVLPQEMLFYLLTPPLMLVNFLLFRRQPILMLAFLGLLIFWANRFLTLDLLALYGMHNIPLRLYVGVFLAGVFAAWLYYGIWEKRDTPALKQAIQPWAALGAGLVLVFFLACSHERFWGGQRILSQVYFPWFSAAAALLLLTLLWAQENRLIQGVFASLPLRALGLVSFSLYIFHPLILEVLRKGTSHYFGTHLSGFPFFLSTLVASYLFACISYSLLERPFVRST